MQRHIIRQQIIEVTTDDEAGAYQLQTELSLIYTERILPLIERACNQISAPNELLRIDSLLLDIGTISPDDLESMLVERVAALLPDALKRVTRRSGNQTETSAELLIYFAYMGVLPWWVSDPRPDLIPRTVMQLAGSPDLAVALRAIAESADSLMRLVRHLDDDMLAALSAALAPQPRADFTRWIGAFRPPTRHHFWANFLRLLVTEPTLALADMLRVAVDQTASDANISLSDLIARADAIQRDLTRSDVLLVQSDIAATQTDQIDELSAVAPFAVMSIDYSQIERRLLSVWEQGTRQTSTLLLAFPPNERAYIERVIADLHKDIDLRAPLTHAEFTSLLSAIRDQIAEDVRRAGAAETSSHRTPAPLPLDRRVSQPSALRPIDLRFSDGAAVYVENAGLVILWQFLVPFFVNVGLLAERQFKDAAAQQRATGLLHVLATGHADFPEFLLPLNKVLCGLPLDTPFDFGEPLTDAESEACAALLLAVVDRAPVLRSMTPDGLRGTFLLRRGALTGQEGGWLLRVERQTYDLVLDQFPWSWTWVRLPWMDAPMRVEW